MRKNFLIALLLCSQKFYGQDSLETSPQKDNSRFYISLEGGPSFPLSDYGDGNINNPKSGLSLIGASAKLRGGFEITPNFLVVADIIWFYNPVDAKALLDDLTAQNPPELKYKVNTEPWIILGAMGGVATKLDLDNTDCELKALLGVVQGSYSKTTYNLTDGVDTLSVVETSDDVLGISLNIGISFRFKISKRLGVVLSGDYFVSELTFDNVNLKYSDGRPSENGRYNQPVSAFHLSIGAFIKF